MRKLVLIDGHAILHRAYHAFPKNLTTRRGELVNAVYGFTRMLLKVIADLQPDYLAATFDLPQPTFRHKLYLGYQHKRPVMEAELAGQIKRVHQVVETLKVPIFERIGFEADDLIGTLAKQAARRKLKTIIVTGDKDIMQLIGKRTKIYTLVRGFSDTEIFGKKEVFQLLGVWPKQIIDYKALVGDASDNYPGVPGVGPKTAVQLLNRYKDLKTIYAHLDELKPLLAKKLIEGKRSAILSKELAKIKTNAPVKLSLKACRVHDYDRQKAIKLFEELEFKSLINKLPGVEKQLNQDSKQQSEQTKLF